jgi:hypothetical protein
MANHVKLHHAQNEFNSLIKETSDFLGIREVLIVT